MRADLARVTASNEAKLAPQVNLCDSVLSDLDEGVFLAKVSPDFYHQPSPMLTDFVTSCTDFHSTNRVMPTPPL